MAKKTKCPPFENHERWLVSFADMMTLLFALFVVLYALKKGGKEEAAIISAAAAIQESFNEIMEDIPVDRRVGPVEQGFGIFEHMKGTQVRPPLLKKYPSDVDEVKVIDEEMNKVNMRLEDRLYGPNRQKSPDRDGAARIVSVHRDTDGFRIRLLAAHFYDPGAFQVRREALGELGSVAKIVQELGRRITVEGHTDSIPPRAGASNWELSALRASYVVKYLIEQQGFPTSKIAAAGYADTRPIASNATEESRRLNRRIEIKIHYD